MSSRLSASEKVRTEVVSDHKRQALVKLVSRALEITSRQTDQVFVHAFGERTLKQFTYGDIFDLANVDALVRAIQTASIDVPTLQVQRAVNMIALISEKTEPCENTRCGEFPIYELGGVVRLNASSEECLYCHHTPTPTVEATKCESVDTSKRIIGGDYQIERFIAEGAIGRTYLATDLTIGLPVCVKHCFKLNASRQENLLAEARNMWDLRHHGIPAIRKVIKLENGTVAIVMSFIPGETLEAIIKRDGKIHAESVAWILERLLNVLQYLHVHSVIHGDFKPQNILVDETTYAVTVVDFGLALVKPTDASRAIGYTDHFAPPEQVRGETLDPRADMYALGKVALHMLNGGNMDATDRDQFPSDVPPVLQDFIQTLVNADIEKRPMRADRLFDKIKRLRRDVYKRELFNTGEKPMRGVS